MKKLKNLDSASKSEGWLAAELLANLKETRRHPGLSLELIAKLLRSVFRPEEIISLIAALTKKAQKYDKKL